MHDNKAPPPSSSPTLPPLEQDRLFRKLTKGSAHATQMVPNYEDFRLGHGDPLLKARMQHDFDVASPRSKKKIIQSLQDSGGGEIHLVQNLAPVPGLGFNDIVHIDKNSILSVPDVRPWDNEKTTNEEEGKEERTSPFGFNDVVHLPDGTVLSVPILPVSKGGDPEQ